MLLLFILIQSHSGYACACGSYDSCHHFFGCFWILIFICWRLLFNIHSFWPKISRQSEYVHVYCTMLIKCRQWRKREREILGAQERKEKWMMRKNNKKKITTVKPTYQRVRKKENWREKRETEKRFTRRSDWLMSAYHWYVTCISSLDTDMNSYISIYIHIWAYWLFFLTLSFSLSSRAWLHRIVFVY